MKSTEWLAIQSFGQDQDILSAINTILIHTKLRLAGIEDEARAAAVAQAREELEAYLETLERIICQAEEAEGGALVGVDPRLRQLARSFVAAKQERRKHQSVLFEESPSHVADLLTATDEEKQKALIESLSELRTLIEEHFYTNASQILSGPLC